MKNLIADISLRQAARIVGIAFITSFILAVFVGNFILPNFINPGDTETLANDIKDNERLFSIAIVVYLIILALDATIAVGLFILLKPVNRILASLSGLSLIHI